MFSAGKKLGDSTRGLSQGKDYSMKPEGGGETGIFNKLRVTEGYRV